jgi:TRAP-type C4-dicarboxylate transport system permease small subunit
VSVDLLRARMAPWLIRSVELLGNAAMATVFIAIGWIYLQSGWDKFRTDAMVLSVGQWPAWIPDAIVVVGALSISLRLLGRTIGHALSLLLRQPLIELPTSVKH